MDEYERRYMAPDERVLFREKIASRAAFGGAIAFLVVFGGVGISLVAAAAWGVVPGSIGFVLGPIATAFGLAMGVLGAMFSVSRAMVTTSGVHVHFGWSKRKIPFPAIQSIRSMRQKGSRRGKVSVGLDGVVRTWVGNSPSGIGVEIAYQDEGGRKHVLTIGSDEADRFVEAVESARAAARARIATSSPVEGELASDDGEALAADHRRSG